MLCSLFKSMFTCCCHRSKEEPPRSEYEPIQEEIPRRETPIPDDPTPTSSLKFSIKPPSTLSDEAAHRSWADFDGVHFTDEENQSSSLTDLPPIETSRRTAESTPGVEDGAGEDSTPSSGGPHHRTDERDTVLHTSLGTKELISNPGMCSSVILSTKTSTNSATTTDQPRLLPLSSFYRNRAGGTYGEDYQHAWQAVITNPEVLSGHSLPALESPQQSPNNVSGAGETLMRSRSTAKRVADTQSGLDTPFQEAACFTTPNEHPELKQPLSLMNEAEHHNRFLNQANQRLLKDAHEVVHAPSEARESNNQDDDSRVAVFPLDAESSSEMYETSDSLSSDEVPAVLGGVPNPAYWGKRRVLKPPYWEDEEMPKTPYREDKELDFTEDYGYSDQSSFGTADVESVEKTSAAFFTSQSQWEMDDDLAYHPHDSVFHSPDMWTRTGSFMGDHELYHHSQDGEISLLEISPIPFNPLYERTSTRTPSIHSDGSEFHCESPLFEKSVKAMSREKYLEGPDCLPKAAIAAGLIGISKGELSLKAPRNKKRSLSVFRDQSPDLGMLAPKPLTRGPLQDVTSHYCSEANAQPISDYEEGKEKSTNNGLHSNNEGESMLQFDTATLMPLIDGHSTISQGDSTTYLGSSLIIPSSSPRTPLKPLRSQSAEDLRNGFMSSPIPFRAPKKVPPPLPRRPGGAGAPSTSEVKGAPNVGTSVLSPENWGRWS